MRARPRTAPRRQGLAGAHRPVVRAAVPPLLDDAPRPAQPRACSAPRVAVLIAIVARPADARAGRAEDAAVRQQVGVPGRRRHARGHAGGADGRRAARARRLPDAPARGDRLPGLCRHRRADQLQRPGAPVLPARRRRGRRPAGESGRQASAQRAEPCHRDAPASRAAGDRPAPRRQRQGGRSAAGPAGAVAARRRDLRARRRGPARGRPGGARACSSRRPASSTSTTAASPPRRASSCWSTAARPRCSACRRRRS